MRGLLDLGLAPNSLVEIVRGSSSDQDEERQAALERQIDALFFQTTPALRTKIPRLVERLRDPDSKVRLSALLDLNRFADPDGVPTLIHLLRDPDPKLRHKALLAANLWGDSRCIPGLHSVFDSADPPDRSMALQLLVRFDDPEAIGRIEIALADPQLAVRLGAVEALGQIESAEALAKILDLLLGPEPALSEAAKGALLALDPNRVVPGLISMLESNPLDVRGRGILLRTIEQVAGESLPPGWKDLRKADTPEALQKLAHWWAEQTERTDR